MDHRTARAARLSGIDPDGRRLRRLHAIRSSRAAALKKAEEDYRKACSSVEHYWDEVREALEDQQAISEVHT